MVFLSAVKRFLARYRWEAVALLLSVLAVAGSLWVSAHVYERLPHLEDEIAYWWQAEVAAHGQLTVPSPPGDPQSFLVPFVVDWHGRRFGKYPLGWPVVLGLAMRLGCAACANALLAGLAVWLTFRLGAALWRPEVGVLAAALTLTSPFFWLNSGSLLSHPLELALSAAFALLWARLARHDGAPPPAFLPWLTGATLGALALTRPWTAVGVALPFALHGLWLLWRGTPRQRKAVLAVGVTAAGVASLHFAWQWALTGDPLRNPYTLWWPYDKIGFGPGHGRYGHTLHMGWINTRFSLQVGMGDLFGWGRFSWIFLPLGLWAVRRDVLAWPVLGVFPSLVVVYLAYWVGAWLFGPRYYYEGLYSLTLLTATGIFWLAGWPLKRGKAPSPRTPRSRWAFLRGAMVAGMLAFLVIANARWYLPPRLQMMHGLYGISRERLAPFLTPEAQALTPAVVFVHTEHWMPYGALLTLEDPWLTTPFIFAWSRGPRADARVRAAFPQRRVIRYNPRFPYHFVLIVPSG
ncbi:MAG TPA: hypothetical protein ENJ54_05625 [Chloroflexi bacterium]|nr:hypothetical protein [Chloroflexota bacterium]